MARLMLLVIPDCLYPNVLRSRKGNTNQLGNPHIIIVDAPWWLLSKRFAFLIGKHQQWG